MNKILLYEQDNNQYYENIIKCIQETKTQLINIIKSTYDIHTLTANINKIIDIQLNNILNECNKIKINSICFIKKLILTWSRNFNQSEKYIYNEIHLYQLFNDYYNENTDLLVYQDGDKQCDNVIVLQLIHCIIKYILKTLSDSKIINNNNNLLYNLSANFRVGIYLGN